MSRRKNILLATLALAAVSGTLSADTIKLEGGRTIRGQILDDKSSTEMLVVKLQTGNAEVTIERRKIQEIIREKNPAEEYEEIKGTFADTAEDQFKLAMWCETKKLIKQRKVHLQKAIELDPDHAQAREKLGYVKREGTWMTPNELKEAKGLVRFNGRYVTPQEREILEQKKRQDDEEKEWHARVKMWKGWMIGNDSAKARIGEERLKAIDNPNAMEAVLGHLGKEQSEPLRVLMCVILGNLPGEQATAELVKRCIIDASPNVRWAAIERLVEREDPSAVRSLIKTLSSEHNTVVRRAADALGSLDDASAVPALIDALVTKHKQVITRGGGGSLASSSSGAILDFEPVVAPGVVAYRVVGAPVQQGVGFSTPSQEVVTLRVDNQEVHNALVEITKEDFGYNQEAWRAWLASQRQKDNAKKR